MEYIHQDSLGSSSVSTSAAGAQVAGLKYLPFGSLRSSTGTLGTDERFTGQRLASTRPARRALTGTAFP